MKSVTKLFRSQTNAYKYLPVVRGKDDWVSDKSYNYNVNDEHLEPKQDEILSIKINNIKGKYSIEIIIII